MTYLFDMMNWRHTSLIAPFALFYLVAFIGSLLIVISETAIQYRKSPEIVSKSVLDANNEALIPYSPSIVRTITAYTTSPDETDSTPCISASGLNVCTTKKNIVASNEFPFGTQIKILDKIYEVQDRTNPRYKNRIDILMDSKQEALTWGIKNLPIQIDEDISKNN